MLRTSAPLIGALGRRYIGRAELTGRPYSEMKNYIADSYYGTKTIRISSATSTTGPAQQLEQTWALEEQGAINDLELRALEAPLCKCTVGFEAPRR